MAVLSRLPCFSLALALAWIAPEAGCAQTPALDAIKKGEAAKGKETKAASVESRILNAERITRLQVTMQQDRDGREKLKVALGKLNDDVRKVSGDVADIQGQMQAKSKRLAALDGKSEEAQGLSGELNELTIYQSIAAEQLELTIKERKLVQDRVAGVEQKLLQNQLVLDALLNDDGKEAVDKSDPVLAKAREEAKRREEKAKEAEHETKSIEQRIRAMGDFADLERSLLENDKKKLDLALAQQKTLEEDRSQKIAKGAAPEEVARVAARIDAARKQAAAMQASITERTERIGRLERDLTAARGEKALADQEAALKKAEADRAGADVKRLENPFNPQNMLRWLVEHGPRMLLVLVGMLGLFLIVRTLDKRLVNFMARRGGKGTPEEREKRARTLAGVFHNFGMLLVWAGGCLMMLEEMGIPVIPLMGGAAILGLAVAFGAQNLIKDYFYGFVILLENQYMVNDVIKIGEVSGSVERITLRMTVLRDIEGVVHFMPHGQVSGVSNLTHGWSQALFEIAVAYKEDVDRVMEVLLSVGRELRSEAAWQDLITEEPEMLGVDQFSDSAVLIKFVMKTRPLQQWKVKREMMRRIKNKFDELGVSMPFPQRVVYHQYQNEALRLPGEKAA